MKYLTSLILSLLISISVFGQEEKLNSDSLFAEKVNETPFGFIKDLESTSRNQIVIYDHFIGLMIFDLDGNLISEYMSKGRGPGDYESISDILVLKKTNSLLIVDDNLHRISKFNLENWDFVDSYLLPILNYSIQGQFLPNKIWSLDNLGQYVIEYKSSYSKANIGKQRTKKYVLFDKEFQVIDQEFLELPDDEMLVIDNDDGFIVSVMPFGRKSMIDFNPDGSYIYNWSGNNCFKTEKETHCIDLDKRKISELTYTNLYESEDGDLYRKADLPKTYPVFDDIYLDKDGKFIWATRRLSKELTKVLKISTVNYKILNYWIIENKFKLLHKSKEDFFGMNFPVYGYEAPVLKKYSLVNK